MKIMLTAFTQLEYNKIIIYWVDYITVAKCLYFVKTKTKGRCMFRKSSNVRGQILWIDVLKT